jgi:hypothetical protein
LARWSSLLKGSSGPKARPYGPEHRYGNVFQEPLGAILRSAGQARATHAERHGGSDSGQFWFGQGLSALNCGKLNVRKKRVGDVPMSDMSRRQLIALTDGAAAMTTLARADEVME